MKIGILKETFDPFDSRVALVPADIVSLQQKFSNLQFIVQESENRIFTNKEYKNAGIQLVRNLNDCDIIIGIKKPDIQTLIPEKTYLFFAHVAKKQPQNKNLLNTLINNRITLIDYEYLRTKNGKRIIGFGKWAGIAGAYETLRAWGIKTGKYNLLPAKNCNNYSTLIQNIKNINLSNTKIIVTGHGRVSKGVTQMLKFAGMKQVAVNQFINKISNEAVFCQISGLEYFKHKYLINKDLNHLYYYPEEYISDFQKFYQVTDILITGHYWNPNSPVFFNLNEINSKYFKISIIGDITCDINGSIPTTIKASDINNPYYDIDRDTGTTQQAFSSPNNITVMAVENLPCLLARESSFYFSDVLKRKVINCLVNNHLDPIIEKATILKKGNLTSYFSYLDSWH